MTNCVVSGNTFETFVDSDPPDSSIGEGIEIQDGDWTITRNVVDGATSHHLRIYQDFEGEISYNLFSGITHTQGVYATGNDGTMEFYNNTFVKTSAGNTFLVQLGEAGFEVTNVTFRNNTLADLSASNSWALMRVVDASSAVTLSNNLYDDADGTTEAQWKGVSYSDKATWESNSGEDDSVWDEPVFVSTSDFQLGAGSPAIDAGTDVSLTQDILGNAIIAAPDIGAYEYQGTDFYVDATEGDDSHDGLTLATAWKTIAHVNSQTLSPGDNVYFQRGETWREQVTVDESGSSSNPITFGAYGTGANPILSGADLVTDWTSEGGGVYSKAEITTEPNYAWFDDALGTKEVSQGALNANDEWYWNADTLYIYSSTDPSGKVVEAGSRDYALVGWSGTSYYTVDGLAFQKNNSTWAGAVLAVGTTSESQGVTVQNCTFRYIPKAISIYSVNNVVVSDNVITGHGAGTVSGIDFNDGGVSYNAATTVTVSGNTISQVVYGVVSPNTGTEHINAATISNNTISDCAREGLSFNLADGMTVESNIVSNCGGAGDYSGIHFWEVANAIVRYNTVSGQRDSGAVGGNGIQIDTNTDAAEVYYNLVYDSDGAGISVIDAAGVLIYNNTLYDNGQNNSLVDGVYLAGPSLDTTSATIKNNIGYATNNYAIYIDSNTSDNSLEFDANLWYKAAGNWWYDGSTGGDSLDAWNLKSYVTDDLEGDPVFVSSSDFQLATGSPAIDAGVRIGFGTDILGNPIVGDPDMGAYEVQP
jgi:hypothetical protein